MYRARERGERERFTQRREKRRGNKRTEPISTLSNPKSDRRKIVNHYDHSQKTVHKEIRKDECKRNGTLAIPAPCFLSHWKGRGPLQLLNDVHVCSIYAFGMKWI